MAEPDLIEAYLIHLHRCIRFTQRKQTWVTRLRFWVMISNRMDRKNRGRIYR